jgi:hypothetical protein
MADEKPAKASVKKSPAASADTNEAATRADSNLSSKSVPAYFKTGNLVVALVLAMVTFALGAIIGTIGAGAASTASGSTSAGAYMALSDFDVNDATSETVYQQQVTALWAVKDLSFTLAEATSSIASAQAATLWVLLTVATLLFLLTATVAIVGRRLISYLASKQ